MKSFILLLLPFCAHAFSRLTSVAPQVDIKPIIAGSTKPLENFDPLNLSSNEERIPFFREAELKHGRLAMMAAPTILLIEQFTKESGIHQFEKFSPSLQLGLVSIMFVSEFSSMLRGWKNPFEKDSTSNYFKLQDNYQPGDFGFGVIGDLDSEEGEVLLNKELNNGRLAMIGAAGMIAQELVTGNPLF